METNSRTSSWTAEEMGIDLSPQAALPVYRQIAERIRSKILLGDLQPGSKLPPVRKLAAGLGVALVTVQRAYDVLRSSKLLEARTGSGTMVARELSRAAGTTILASLTESGPMATFESLSESIGLRSLATAVPDPKLFLADEFVAELRSLDREDPWLWYYGSSKGHPELCREILKLVEARGISARDEEIVVTQGSTQALSILLDLVGPTNGCVIVEQPTALLLRDLIASKGMTPIDVRLRDGVLDIECYEATVKKHHGSLAILSGSFHPATGRAIPVTGRRSIAKLSNEHQVQVIELDRLRLIAFEEPPPPLAALDPNTIHIDSFSYCLVPGLRVGFVRAPFPVARELTSAMKLGGISGAQFLQLALARYLAQGNLESHLRRVLPVYRSRRDALLQALEVSMPRGTSWTVPQGGFSTWVSLPPGQYEGLYEACLARGCAFVPGSLVTGDPDPRFLRLSFGLQDPTAIREAVQVLANEVRGRS